MDTDRIMLQTILQLGYAAYERRQALPDHVRRAVWAILAFALPCWAGMCRRVLKAMWNGSGTIRVATGCVRSVPGYRWKGG